MIDKINNNQVSDILRDASARQTNCSRSSAENKADASLQVSYESLVEKIQPVFNGFPVAAGYFNALSSGLCNSVMLR